MTNNLTPEKPTDPKPVILKPNHDRGQPKPKSPDTNKNPPEEPQKQKPFNQPNGLKLNQEGGG